MKSFVKSIVAIAVLALAVFALPAFAHKVIISAYSEGEIIEGEIGFSGGAYASDIVIEILDDDGAVLGQSKTDEDGIFQFTPTKRVPHTFKANLGQGHVAIYRMGVDELPETLGRVSENNSAQPSNDRDGVSEPTPAVEAVPIGSTYGVDPQILKQIVQASVKQELAVFKSEIDSSVRRVTKPLRKEIAAYKEKNDLQSILGGVGYILGLFGVGFYIAARRERRNLVQQSASNEGPNE